MHDNRQYAIFPCLEVPCEDMLSCLRNKVKIEAEVMNTQYLQSEHFFGVDEVSYVCSGVLVVHVTVACRVEFGEVIFPFLIAHIHYALSRENHAVSSVACWHNAVEHIHTALNRFEDIPWCADAHEVARFGGGEYIVNNLYHLVHLFGWFTDSESSDSVAVTV